MLNTRFEGGSCDRDKRGYQSSVIKSVHDVDVAFQLLRSPTWEQRNRLRSPQLWRYVRARATDDVSVSCRPWLIVRRSRCWGFCSRTTLSRTVIFSGRHISPHDNNTKWTNLHLVFRTSAGESNISFFSSIFPVSDDVITRTTAVSERSMFVQQRALIDCATKTCENEPLVSIGLRGDGIVSYIFHPTTSFVQNKYVPLIIVYKDYIDLYWCFS